MPVLEVDRDVWQMSCALLDARKLCIAPGLVHVLEVARAVMHMKIALLCMISVPCSRSCGDAREKDG